MDAMHDAMTFDPEAAEAKGGAGEAFALRRGGCRDFAHVFIACARWLDIPARFVSGYLAPRDAPPPQGLYAWAEAEAPVLGWVAFDPVAQSMRRRRATSASPSASTPSAPRRSASPNRAAAARRCAPR